MEIANDTGPRTLVNWVIGSITAIAVSVSTFFIKDMHSDFKGIRNDVGLILVQQNVLSTEMNALEKDVQENKETLKKHEGRFAEYEKKRQEFFATYELKKK